MLALSQQEIGAGGQRRALGAQAGRGQRWGPGCLKLDSPTEAEAITGRARDPERHSAEMGRAVTRRPPPRSGLVQSRLWGIHLTGAALVSPSPWPPCGHRAVEKSPYTRLTSPNGPVDRLAPRVVRGRGADRLTITSL